MKVNGNGQGKILTSDELRLLFADGFTSPRERALFGICLFTGCRVSEALALQTTDIKGQTLTFRLFYHQRETQNPCCGHPARASGVFS